MIFNEFIKILNSQNIIPILMGSKGIDYWNLEKETEIELLVFKKEYSKKKQELEKILNMNEFKKETELKFTKDKWNFIIKFSEDDGIDKITSFTKVYLTENKDGSYYQLSLNEYENIYKKRNDTFYINLLKKIKQTKKDEITWDYMIQIEIIAQKIYGRDEINLTKEVNRIHQTFKVDKIKIETDYKKALKKLKDEEKKVLNSPNKTIDIVSGFSQNGILKKAYPNSNIIRFDLDLGFGKLNELKNFKRPELDLIDSTGYHTYKSEMFLLKTILKEKKIIRIWSSKSNIHEYLLLLYLCSLFKEKEIHVLFSDELNPYCRTIGCMTSKEIKLLKKQEHILNTKEKECYSKEWNSITRINSEIRFLKNGKVFNSSFEEAENMVLKELKNIEPCTTVKLISHLMCYHIIDYFNDGEYLYLIQDLITKEKIKIIKSGENTFKVKEQKRNPTYYHTIETNI